MKRRSEILGAYPLQSLPWKIKLKRWRNHLRRGPGDLTWRKSLTIIVTVSAIIVGIKSTQLGISFDDYVTRQAEFSVRSWLGRDPVLDTRLKIFVYDDPTVSYVDGADLPLDDWATIFESLAGRKPAAILVDKLFDLPRGLEQKERFLKRVHDLPVPLITAGFVSAAAIAQRQELSLDFPWYSLARLRQETALSSQEAYPALPPTRLYAYGPHRDLAPALTHVGHVVYSGGGRIKPLLRLDTTTVVPHLALLAAKTLQLGAGKLLVNATEVPMTAGAVQVNLPEPQSILQRTYAMRDLIIKAREKRPVTLVEPGDFVLILPGMYTGSTDFLPTPVGMIPGGYIVTALLNSVLNGQWLRAAPAGWVLVVLATFAGMACGLTLWGVRFLATMASVSGLFVLIGLGTFAYGGVSIQWLYSTLAFAITALCVFAERSRLAREQQLLLARELETARLVQRTFFPKPQRQFGRLQINGQCVPVGECGGDWWWHFVPTPGTEYILIGDVMGHGVPAALVTGLIYSCFNTLAELWTRFNAEDQTPANILRMMNRVLYFALGGEVTMTMVVACFSTDRQTLRFANAGHRFPLLFPADPTDKRFGSALRPSARRQGPPVLTLLAPGSVLGITRDVVCDEREIPLKSGDKILFYTDGVAECRGRDGKTLGQKEFVALAGRHSVAPVANLTTNLIDALRERLPHGQQDDDFTIVAVGVA